MENRRQFLGQLARAGVVTGAGALTAAQPADQDRTSSGDRGEWVKKLRRVVEPVLAGMAADQLKARMPVECPAGNAAERRAATHLEALGRTLAGAAPWLELISLSGEEGDARGRLAALARQGLANATNPNAADYLNFTAGPQNLVDAAFLAHALLRARNELWEKLDGPVQRRLIAALQSTRKFRPGQNNWLLFSAMIETVLARVGADWKADAIDTALRAHEQWYKGDGMYGDGPEFHWDYYNSFVIQPFLVDVLEQIGNVTARWAGLQAGVRRRARRYAAVQERLIAPDGSYPPLGRSIAYRCGAFQLLAQMALRQELPEGVTAAQVRCALTEVIRRTLDAPGTFDADGWLRVGLAGHQPSLGERYISTGSLYLCAVAFLPLGLPPEATFWSAPRADWSSRKLWSGGDLPADHALSGGSGK